MSRGEHPSILLPHVSFPIILIGVASLKFPEGTVAGMYKQAVASNSEYDIVRFDDQKLNWTLKEFDVSVKTFAHFLPLET